MLQAILIVVLAVVGCSSAQPKKELQSYRQAIVTVNHYPLQVMVADTEQKRSEGLAIKDHIDENEGMLFVFQKSGNLKFWMKDMKFPIDIIWLDENQVVRYIMPNLTPCRSYSLCPNYGPDQKMRYVLETTSGFAARHHIVINETKVQIDFTQ